MMDSPEPSKIKGSSSVHALNAIANTPSSESPQVQESPFLRFVNNLSPIKPVKACHVAQGFLGLNSPPLVFKSPRISHRDTQFLERAQGTQSSNGEISQSGNGGNILDEAPGDSNKSNSEQPLQERFITDTQKDIDIKNDANKSCSPTPSVDEYLADPGDIDHMYSVNPDVEQSTDAVESSLSDLPQSKKSLLNFDRKDDPGDKAEEPLSLSDESNRVQQERPAYVEVPEKIEGEIKDVEWTSQDPTKLESNLAADVFDKQNSHDSLPQCAGNERRDHNCTPQLLPDPLQDIQESEDCNEMVSTSHLSAENISQDGSEASLKYHGTRRRCLQFEEAACSAFGSNKSHMKLNATSSQMKMVKLSEPITSLFPQRGSGNLPVTGSKPSGIGLHLNSIINAMPPGRSSTTGMRLSDGSQGMKSTTSISLHKVENMKRSLISPNMDGQSLVDTRNESHGTDASVAADSFISEPPSLTKPITLYPASVHDKRKLSPTYAGNSEESNQPSPGKKKKKTSVASDDNDRKRCNCKKSKCLKLYCDCFAAGIFCGEHCSCQGCLNKEEYEDKVLETKQQIESRNPLAFAPKIVQCTTDVQANNMEDTNLTTPSSARHKRGCNCKRSMCLKKYCECYQANVGCSSGCRCEGCKNVFGRKEDYVALEHALGKERVSSSVERGSDSIMNKNPEMVASRRDLLQTEVYNLQHLSPLTPSLQCSDQGKDAAQAKLLSGNYLPSPESDVNVLSSDANYTKSSENLHSSLTHLQTNEMLGTSSYHSEMDCNNVNVQDPSSPPCDSVPMGKASSFSSKANEWKSVPDSKLVFHGCIRQLSGGSLRWRSSPITPKTNVGETQYLPCLESDSKLFDILEDETPDVLKEASTPIKSVKANSPIQKRVSPPPSHVRGIGSSSSGGLRSGRRFVLRSVPSFPPLTPCVDSKGNGTEDSGNNASK